MDSSGHSKFVEKEEKVSKQDNFDDVDISRKVVRAETSVLPESRDRHHLQRRKPFSFDREIPAESASIKDVDSGVQIRTLEVRSIQRNRFC